MTFLIIFDKVKSRAENRVKNKTGESIAEVLISLLITAVSVAMLASMVATSVRIINNSENTLQEYYKSIEVINNTSGEYAGRMNVTAKIGETNISDKDSGDSADYYVIKDEISYWEVPSGVTGP